MNKKFIRIIPKMDIKNGLLIKGINLDGLRILGDPYNFAEQYYKSGADEIFYIDNVASLYGTNNLSKFVTKTSKNLFVPLSVGGGIHCLSQIEDFLKKGADKEWKRYNKNRSKSLGKKVRRSWSRRNIFDIN